MQVKEIVLTPQEAFDESIFYRVLYSKLSIPINGDVVIKPTKRSIDARGRTVNVRIQYELLKRNTNLAGDYSFQYSSVQNAPPVLVIGAGPAGLFAALRLIELGYKPIVLERGNDVQARRRDLAAINKEHIVNPESNYCFGEGGAGTYSDGKLYTRSKKRGDVQRIMHILVAHGAKEDILFDAHPHIGTNKLPKLVEKIRHSIQQFGGEIHFNTRVMDFIIKGDRIEGVVTQHTDKITGVATILATGHSARDMYELLYNKQLQIEAKAFALGVRVEHPQQLIDRIQYHCITTRDPYLPASSYTLVHQALVNKKQKGVFSFCMCPGGFIVPAATAPGEVVVNGMSPSRRDSKFANSGIVMALDESDFLPYQKYGALAGLYFQKEIEKKTWEAGGKTQTAPAQRLTDFLEKRSSSSLLETSYQPGLAPVDLNEVIPTFIADALHQGFKNFGSKMKGYLTNEAQLVAVESRTSSPVRIPRDKDTLQHTQIKNLFPCGEGAGYAGGIVSAAMDGERCAEAVERCTRYAKP